MDGKHRLGVRRQLLGKLFGVHVVGDGIDIDEIDFGAKGGAGGGGGDPGERRGEHAVAGFDAEPDEGEEEGGGAVGAGAGVFGAAVRREVVLELDAGIAGGGCVLGQDFEHGLLLFGAVAGAEFAF